jgi:hypothetical protein
MDVEEKKKTETLGQNFLAQLGSNCHDRSLGNEIPVNSRALCKKSSPFTPIKSPHTPYPITRIPIHISVPLLGPHPFEAPLRRSPFGFRPPPGGGGDFLSL